MDSRKHILSKRKTAVSDLSKVAYTSGEIDPFSNEFIGSLARNNVYNVGLGTETEQGLTPARYPIRVVLDNGSPEDSNPLVVIRGFRMVTARFENVAFQRTPPGNHTAINNLLSCIMDIDSRLNAISFENRQANLLLGTDTLALQVTLYEAIREGGMNAEQMARAAETFDNIVAAATREKLCPYFKVGTNEYLLARRHQGSIPNNRGNMIERKIATEFNLTYKANHMKLDINYPETSVGLRNFCSYATAWYFRQGLYECYESKEFHTIVVRENPEGVFTITKSSTVDGYEVPEHFTVGSTISLDGIRYNKTMIAVAPGGVYCAGVNHYSYNHTTAGTILGGVLLTLLKTHNLYDDSADRAGEENQTALIYETFHPVNKRAIANIFFKRSRVSSYGKPSGSPAMQLMALDSFLALRQNPSPAGAHKAYICGSILAMVTRQGLAPFLSYAGEMNQVIDTIESIIIQGARSHVGASYYTGNQGISQGSQLDIYMPELAFYMQTMAPQSTLCLSPHVSREVAANAGANFMSVVKKMKGKDLGAVSEAAIERFLAASGKKAFIFDIEDESTWGPATADGKSQSERIVGILNL